MALTEDQKTALNFKKFLAAILPYIGGGGGHTIKDSDDTEMTPRAGLKFSGDLEVSDDSENDETEVAPHRLTSEELADICSPLPAGTANLPVLFDESGAEYVVGRYVNSQGKWKPVYEKTLVISNPPDSTDISDLHIADAVGGVGIIKNAVEGTTDFLNYVHPNFTTQYGVLFMLTANNTILGFRSNGHTRANLVFTCTLQYTKTTDTYQD